jgi:hypothetical protein
VAGVDYSPISLALLLSNVLTVFLPFGAWERMGDTSERIYVVINNFLVGFDKTQWVKSEGKDDECVIL